MPSSWMDQFKPETVKTFGEYSTQFLLPYIKSQLSYAKRIDLERDEHIANSLKATSRSKRWQGARRRVQATSQIPRKWQQFLRNEDQKRERF